MSSTWNAWMRRARFAVLLAPAALLGGCYVVPIVPVGRPYYRYPAPAPAPYYRGYDRGYYRGYHGENDKATPQQPVADAGTPHIEVASISR